MAVSSSGDTALPKPAAAPPPPRASLLCRAKPGKTLAFEVRGTEAVVGRDPSASVSISLEGISRRHAKITWDGRSYWVEDLQSTNGTFVNGLTVQRDKLRHLDVLTLGRKVDLLFLVRSTDRPATARRTGIVRAALIPEGLAADMAIEVPAGQATLGRSPNCNIIADAAGVSKLHARIERGSDLLTLQDLGSANGTFVNGVRVMSAILKDGDVLSLAGQEPYRVVVETGEITSASVTGLPAVVPALAAAVEEGPRFSQDWQTRIEGEPAAGAKKTADMPAAAGEVTQKRPTLAPRKAPPPADAPKPAPPPAAPAAAAVGIEAPTTSMPTVPPPAAAEATPLPPPQTGGMPATPAAETAPISPGAPAVPVAFECRLLGGGFELAVHAPGTWEIGRSKEAQWQVEHPTVSRRHARLHVRADLRVEIEHVAASNRTLIGGRPVEGLATLADGDTLQFGEVALQVSIRRPPPKD